MKKVCIVDAARSPIGKFRGSLSGLTAPILGSKVVKGILKRTEIGGDEIEHVIVGNVLSAGLGQNPAKQVVVYSGIPNDIPAYSVNMVCASGLKAIGLGAQEIESGRASVVLAGGIESMTNSPFLLKSNTSGVVRKVHKAGNLNLAEFAEKVRGSDLQLRDFEFIDEMMNDGLFDCYTNLHMGALAEKIGRDYLISREEQDKYAFASHMKAARAVRDGRFMREIIPIEADGKIIAADEGIRRDTSLEKLSELKPAFEPSGTITAGNASQLSDGAAFVLLMAEEEADRRGIEKLAIIESYAASGSDPDKYGLAPVPSIKKALDYAGMGVRDVDLFEINEAFCVQVLGVAKEMGIDIEKVNVNGGATAIGHPIGASGAVILSTLIYALNDYDKEVGVASLCHGGGGAFSMVISKA